MNAPAAFDVPSPRIAVIVPAYGVTDLVGQALDSVLAQRFANWECWVVDDGGPDDVAGAVAPYLTDSRIRFLATDNGGVARARNRAIARARAPYVALLDGDDLLRPEYLERMVAALDAHRDARLVTCDARTFGWVRQAAPCASAMQRGWGTVTGTLAEVLDRRFAVYIGSAFRRADWKTIGGFDETMTHCEDFDFWVRLLMLGGHALYLDETLGEYRVRPSSASASVDKMTRGVLKTYGKILPLLADRPERELVRTMMVRYAADLEFESAVDRVLEGDVTGGLASLAHTHREAGGLVWPAALALWRACPALAAPMLRWRRWAYSRQAVGREVAPLDAVAEMTA